MMKLIVPLAIAATVCTHTNETLLRSERAILSAKSPVEMAEPLSCLLQIHEESDGPLRLFAASSLKSLLGAPQVKGVLKDARYSRVAQALEQLTLHANDPVYQSIIAQYAKGDWLFYEMFCSQGDTSFCPDFLPDPNAIQEVSPLLGAAGLVRLKKAYEVLSGKPRDEVATRLKKLYKEIPTNDKLRRKFIDQIYRELFDSRLSLIPS